MSLQQELRKDLILEINYSGSESHHLPIYSQDINRFAGDLIVNNGTLTRLNPNFGGINYTTSDGNATGNRGTAMLTRRMSHGLAVRGIYGWGKSLDTSSSSASLSGGAITSTNQNGPVIQNGDLPAQRGRSDFDIRQQFAFDGTWIAPSHYGNAAMRNVLGGWQFSGVWLAQTGLPFWVYTTAGFSPVCSGGVAAVNGGCPAGSTIVGNSGGDYNADGSNYDVPNVPAFGSHLSGKKKSDFINGIFPASAFPAPALGAEGNLGRNTYDNEGYNLSLIHI